MDRGTHVKLASWMDHRRPSGLAGAIHGGIFCSWRRPSFGTGSDATANQRERELREELGKEPSCGILVYKTCNKVLLLTSVRDKVFDEVGYVISFEEFCARIRPFVYAANST